MKRKIMIVEDNVGLSQMQKDSGSGPDGPGEYGTFLAAHIQQSFSMRF